MLDTDHEPAFDELVPLVPQLLVGAEHERLLQRAAEFSGLGVPDELADRAAGLLDGFSLLDVVEIANAEKLPASEVAGIYFAISERIEADRMLTRITGLPRDDRWSALARSALRYDLYAAMAGLTQNILTSTSADDEPAELPPAPRETASTARERIDLLTSFLRALRDPQKLRVESRAQHRRHVLRIFGAVSALRGEERTAKEKLSSEFFAAVKAIPQL